MPVTLATSTVFGLREGAGHSVGLPSVTDAPIGIVDSGVGGLTVARAILDQLPAERLRYVGDTAYAPDGPRPIAQVREYAISMCDDLGASGVKLLVVACNTAAAACLHDAR